MLRQILDFSYLIDAMQQVLLPQRVLHRAQHVDQHIGIVGVDLLSSLSTLRLDKQIVIRIILTINQLCCLLPLHLRHGCCRRCRLHLGALRRGIHCRNRLDRNGLLLCLRLTARGNVFCLLLRLAARGNVLCLLLRFAARGNFFLLLFFLLTAD